SFRTRAGYTGRDVVFPATSPDVDLFPARRNPCAPSAVDRVEERGVPLRVEAGAALRGRPRDPGAALQVLGDHVLPRLARVDGVVDPLKELPAVGAGGLDVRRGVPAQSVGAILVEPQARAVGDVVADLRPAEVRARTPRRGAAAVGVEVDAAGAVAFAVEAP